MHFACIGMRLPRIPIHGPFPKLEDDELPLPLSVQFDDGCRVLMTSPIIIPFPNGDDKKTVALKSVLVWIKEIYRKLWAIEAFGWYHDEKDAQIDAIFKDYGVNKPWRVSLSF